MGTLVRIAAVADVPPGHSAEFTSHNRIIALFNVDGEIYALDGVCPHAGGPLGKGTLNGAIATCPWHGWQFDVKTGRHCLTDAIRQPKFPVEIRDGEIYVELPEPPG